MWSGLTLPLVKSKQFFCGENCVLGGMGKGEGGGAVSSRSFDLLNSMIYDLKRSVDLR